MTSVWIAAWSISVMISAAAFYCARREGLGRFETLLFAVAFFPAPLFTAMASANSFVYGMDFVVPVAAWVCLRRWPRVARSLRHAAIWIFLGAGVVPFLVCLQFAQKVDLLFEAINCYRLLGAMSLMCIMSSAAFAGRDQIFDQATMFESQLSSPRSALHTPPYQFGLTCEKDGFLATFSWMNLILLAAMLLQGIGLVDSNVFYKIMPDEIFADLQVRFIAAGLFRASLGLIATLGIIAYLAQRTANKPRIMAASGGAIAGVFIILLSGSKTSLLSVFAVAAVCALVFQRRVRFFWPKVIAALVFLGIICAIYLPALQDAYVSNTVGVLNLSEDSYKTLTGRQETWKEGLDLISESPMILLGLPNSTVEELNTAYYHNEFVGLLMVGGVFSVVPYVIGICILGRSLFRNSAQAHPARVFAALTFVAGFIQAMTVDHLTPGILYSCTVALFACAYGLGHNPALECPAPAPLLIDNNEMPAFEPLPLGEHPRFSPTLNFER